MGMVFSDPCILNRQGKTLQFLLNDGIHVNDETKQLEVGMLKTLRIF